MASVDMTITYDEETGTPADVGETLTLLASFPGLEPEKFGLEFALNVGENDAPIPVSMTGGLMGALTELPLGIKAGLKLAVTFEKKLGSRKDVGRALRQIGDFEDLLLHKITLSLPVRDEDAADKLIADLELHLAERAMSVEVAFEKVAPGSFRHGTFPRRTPIDEAIRRAGGAIADFAQRHKVESVTLSSGDKTVTLTPETRERAAELLRKSAAGE